MDIDDLCKASSAVYLATDELVAQNLPKKLIWAVKEIKLLRGIIASQQAVQADAQNLCKYCEDIGRNGEHSWFCRKCGAPLN